MEVIVEPSLEVAAEAINKAIENREVIIAVLKCKVYYEGRSSSILGFGDRIFILKKDGSLLVHRPTGYSPVNWQPETSYVRAEYLDGNLRIVAVRRSPREVLEVEASKIYLLATFNIVDKAVFYEVADEHMIRDFIAKNPREVLGEELETVDVEKHVEPGFIDLYLRDKEGRLVVVEIKRVKASVNAVKQLRRYADALSKYVDRSKIRPLLVAPEFTGSALAAARKLKVEVRKLDLKKLLERIRVEKRFERGILEYL